MKKVKTLSLLIALNLAIFTGTTQTQDNSSHYLQSSKNERTKRAAFSNTTNLRASLRSIRFNDGLIIKSDDLQTTYSKYKQWFRTKSNYKNYPLAYVGGSKPRVKIEVSSSGKHHFMFLRAYGKHFELKRSLLRRSRNGNFISSWRISEVELPRAISCFKRNSRNHSPLKIHWQISADGRNWQNLTTTTHTVYITLGKPNPLSGRYHQQESVYYISCSAARGIKNSRYIFNRIWQAFQDRKVYRVDGRQLRYYGNYHTYNVHAWQLVRDADGQCGSWANLLAACYKIQGVDYPNEYVIVRPKYTRTFTVDSNLPGQGNKNPNNYFANHQLLKINGVYYDPSYGTSYRSLSEAEATISYFGNRMNNPYYLEIYENNWNIR